MGEVPQHHAAADDPVILYDLIIGLHFGLQIFTLAFILTGGGERRRDPITRC